MPANSCRPPIGCGDRNAIRPRSQGETLCELSMYGLIRSFNSKRFSFHRARSTNCSSARPEDVCSPGSSRIPGSDLPHEVHRIWNHFPLASVYQKTPTQKRGCRIFLSVAKEKGEYLDQPRIRRICAIASLLDVITSRHEAKFVDWLFPFVVLFFGNLRRKKEKGLSPDCFCHPSPKQKGRQLAGSRFLRRTRSVRRPKLPCASPWRRAPRPSPSCIRSRWPPPHRPIHSP